MEKEKGAMISGIGLTMASGFFFFFFFNQSVKNSRD